MTIEQVFSTGSIQASTTVAYKKSILTGDASRHHFNAFVWNLRRRRPTKWNVRHSQIILSSLSVRVERSTWIRPDVDQIHRLPERHESGASRRPAHDVLRVALQRFQKQRASSHSCGELSFLLKLTFYFRFFGIVCLSEIKILKNMIVAQRRKIF